ncbi:hypothetical protein M3J09_007936 [Ascochyta lentis]
MITEQRCIRHSSSEGKQRPHQLRHYTSRFN